MSDYTHSSVVSFIWSVADIIRDAGYHQNQYGDLILPFVVLRRLDQASLPTREQAIAKKGQLEGLGFEGETVEDAILSDIGGAFFSTAPITFEGLTDDAANLKENLSALIAGFSSDVRSVMERFEFERHVEKLASKGLLYPVIAQLCEIDLSPERVSNLDMGYIFEECIRRFSELKNEEAGHHYTPREVIQLMVDLLFTDANEFFEDGKIVTMLDPACGTGGMLSIAEARARDNNGGVDFMPYGQDFDDQSYAIALSEQLMTGRKGLHVALGNSLTDEDHYKGRTFDFIVANPPYGVSWKQYADPIVKEHERDGFEGRYGAGLPSKSDGQLLFVQHMLSKMEPATGTNASGSRIAVVLNGSPLFSGQPGGGESEIRRWIIENDWLDCIVGLPNDLFYNTGISTYIWILTNKKSEERKGRVQLIDARDLYEKMRKPLGQKRAELSDDNIAEVVHLYGDGTENGRSKWVNNDDFGFQRVPVQRPRRVKRAPIANLTQIGPLETKKSADDEVKEAAQQGKFGALIVEHPDIKDLLERLSRQAEPLVKAAQEYQDVVTAPIREQAQLVNKQMGAKILASIPHGALQVQMPEDMLDKITSSEPYKALTKKSQQIVEAALYVDDPDGDILTDTKGNPVADSRLRGYETVPLHQDIEQHMHDEVLPHAPDAWPEPDKVKVGYEIPFTEIFYTYEPPPPLEEIDAELKQLEQEILDLLSEVTE